MRHARCHRVMAGLGPATHHFPPLQRRQSWMAGARLAMTQWGHQPPILTPMGWRPPSLQRHASPARRVAPTGAQLQRQYSCANYPVTAIAFHLDSSVFIHSCFFFIGTLVSPTRAQVPAWIAAEVVHKQGNFVNTDEH